MPNPAALEHTISTLAPLDRLATSPGERQAAEWVAAKLEALGCSVSLESEPATDGFPRAVAWLSALGAGAGLASLRGHRSVGVAGGILAAAGIADDAGGGPHAFRRLLLRRRTTTNVVAETGDPASPRTLVVLAHHDAAQSGLVFHQGPQRWVWERWPALIDDTDTSIPLWWPVVGAPALVALGSALGGRRLVWAGSVVAAAALAAFLDIARHPAVPGANDNLSGVAGLVALAEALREQPVAGLRVLLVSCGAEEALQEGIRAFARRHFDSLPTASTWFVNLETVGSPQLVLLEGEGTLRMRDYPESFKDFVAARAQDAGIPLRRGLRSRNSTDSVVPQRAGYPTATFVSVNAWKALSHYHWPTDTPENVDCETVADAVRVVEATMRSLAASTPRAGSVS